MVELNDRSSGTGAGATGAGPPPGTAQPAVELIDLSKSFGPTWAVYQVSLTVPHGSFFGLVGPNGAGKTTTIRVTTGLLRPNGGRSIVNGIDVWADPVAAKATFGVLPDDLRLLERLTGRELLTYVGLLRRLPEDVVRRRTEEVLGVLDLLGDATKLVADYSTGMRKKIALGAAILHAPAVLFLDEPFESVDPVSSKVIRDVLESFRDGGGTIVFSSHVMETVERLCDHVAIMHRSRIVRSGTLAEVTGGESLESAFIAAVGAEGVSGRDALDWLAARPPTS